jgi:hypothetical protein
VNLEPLRALVERDSRRNLSFDLDAPAPLGLDGELTGREFNDVLREAKRQHLVTGELHDMGTSVAWFTLRPTLWALRALGEWPPAGGEALPGRWDEGVWGRRAKDALRELVERPPSGDYLFGPPPGSAEPEPWIQWEATRRLLESGLIEGVLQVSGIQDVRVTAAGHRALAAAPVDPLDAARVHVARDARADAVNAAIEEALKSRLLALAATFNVAVEQANGKPVHLQVLNQNLAKAGAYSNSWGAEITGWLAIRNDVDHGRAANVSPERIERLIDGVDRFLAEHPAP